MGSGIAEAAALSKSSCHLLQPCIHNNILDVHAYKRSLTPWCDFLMARGGLVLSSQLCLLCRSLRKS